MNAEQITKLQQVDHFDLLKEIEIELQELVINLDGFGTTFDEISERREEIAVAYGRSKLLLEILSFQLSIMKAEQESQEADAIEYYMDKFVVEEETYDSMEF